MSKEFEEIVLKKLGNIETELTGVKTAVASLDNRVGSLETTVTSLDNRVGSLETAVTSLDNRMGNVETAVSSLDNRVESLETTVVRLDNRLGSLEIEVSDTKEVVISLKQDFAKFDYEINKKIDTLFDAFEVNKNKDEVHEKSIVSLNTKTFKHDVRISNLEDKVLTV